METRDYKKFKFHPANRAVSQKSVDNLILSIKANGFISGKEIIIDEKGYILDGQHRFTALKSLGMSVPYVVSEGGESFGKIVALNSGQKNWTTADYVKSHASKGIDCYRQLLKYKEETKYTDSMIHAIVVPQLKTKDLKDGREFVPNQDRRDISVFLDGLTITHKTDKGLVSAIVVLFKKASREQIKIVGDRLVSVPRLHSVNEYLIAFENILNYKKRGDNRVKLL